MCIHMDTQPDPKPVQLQLGISASGLKHDVEHIHSHVHYRVSHSSKLWKKPKRPLKEGWMRKKRLYTEWVRCSVATKGT